ncbi:MAG TPA: flagellar motor switch protein FliN [Gammaproteobacteria bacterium]|nr:flagellar motor switch protein FliN [Gammaproteobacteria bacterium]
MTNTNTTAQNSAEAAHMASELGEMAQHHNIDIVLDIPVTLSMELGRTRMSIRDLLQLKSGSVVELQKMADEPLDVLVNGTLVAKGEAVVIEDRFGVRLTDVISPMERVKKLR